MSAASSETVRPRPTIDGDQEAVRVYVWDVVVRITHWVIFLAILVLAATGLYIAHPFAVAPGEASDHFIMGNVKLVHFSAAVVFSLAGIARLVWMFVGPRQARWHQFIPISKERRASIWGWIKFYTLISRDPPSSIGHNALAGLSYTVVFLILLVIEVTGLGLYAIHHPDSVIAPFADLLTLFGGPQRARWFHHVSMWLLAWFVVHHVAAGILVSSTDKSGLTGSIFTGHKWFRKKDLEEAEGEDS